MEVGVGAALLLVVFLYAFVVVEFAKAAFHCEYSDAVIKTIWGNQSFILSLTTTLFKSYLIQFEGPQ